MFDTSAPTHYALTGSEVVSIGTAGGVVVAAAQLWLVRRQAVTQSEDQLASQYRSLMREIPLEALLGIDLDENEYQKTLPVFFHYFDLCNEQAFLSR